MSGFFKLLNFIVMKTRIKLFGSLALPMLFFAVLFNACSKDEDHDQNQELGDLHNPKSTTKHIFMDYGTVKNTYSTIDGELFEWKRVGSINDFNKRIILLDYPQFGTVKCVGKGSDHFKLNIKNETILFNNIVVDRTGTSIQFEASKPNGRTVDVSISDPTDNFSMFLSTVNQGDTIYPQPQMFWPAIIFGAACLVAAGVDYYCDGQIADAAADCAANCMGFNAGTCGGTCIEVCN